MKKAKIILRIFKTAPLLFATLRQQTVFRPLAYPLLLWLFLFNLPSLQAQYAITTERAEVSISYYLVSSQLPNNQKTLKSLGFIVDLNRYPDARLKVTFKAVTLRSDCNVFINPEYISNRAYGLVRTSATQTINAVGETANIFYRIDPQAMQPSLQKKIQVGFNIREGAKVVGMRQGYRHGLNYDIREASPLASSKKTEITKPKIESPKTKENTYVARKSPEPVVSSPSPEKFSSPPPEKNIEREPAPAKEEENISRKKERKPSKEETEPAEEETTSLSVNYTIASDRSIQMKIEGGLPPFELRFMEGPVVSAIFSLGGQREIGLSEAVIKEKAPNGVYQLQVYDRNGQSVKEAKSAETYTVGEITTKSYGLVITLVIIAIGIFIGLRLGRRKKKEEY